ncbi:hypothetical protein BVRB_2g044630 [Beta vulgaris subsp. vulgaris]|uniref:Uncharacterized protein n=1 Tax=Beta vulgaris subsp. vulgaris TaxID=3555 RepID=A0A0J8BDM7_BETVV|nr:hypothetical protein BVRB_2g044630 [Beta vulgaris subsp. vulgaris]
MWDKCGIRCITVHKLYPSGNVKILHPEFYLGAFSSHDFHFTF